MNMARTALIPLLALLLPVLSSVSAVAALQSPFDVAAAREAHGAPLGAFSCSSPPAPVRDLEFDGYYADRGAGSSVVDQQRYRAYRDATDAITRFENGITRLSDQFVASKPADTRPAACALAWLARWAEADAMLGTASQQGGFVRKWGLAPVAATYLKIRDGDALDAAQKRAVEDWIARWARIVRNDYDPTKLESRRNNHLYWAAWSVALAAVVGDDKALFDWSMDKTRLGLAQVTPDGTLPLEMARKARAYHYHVFAAAPLVMTAELAARNGVDLYAERDGALKRLIERVIGSFNDDSFFAKAAAVAQDRSGSSKGPHVAWLEAYVARTGDSAAAAVVKRLRPTKERRLGGDMTLLYSAASP